MKGRLLVAEVTIDGTQGLLKNFLAREGSSLGVRTGFPQTVLQQVRIILCETPWTKSVVGLGRKIVNELRKSKHNLEVLGNCPELDMLDSVEEVGINTVLTYQNKHPSVLITYRPEYLKIVVMDSHSLTTANTVIPYEM
ncbi:hypothetical protein VNO77_44215 [Canavalia gladiata]|uniref:Uncharacterized protein n=1 Tax=Canavalia gladiata TaxID=3824 RepID=A0AAN9PQT0_CANGL